MNQFRLIKLELADLFQPTGICGRDLVQIHISLARIVLVDGDPVIRPLRSCLSGQAEKRPHKSDHCKAEKHASERVMQHQNSLRRPTITLGKSRRRRPSARRVERTRRAGSAELSARLPKDCALAPMPRRRTGDRFGCDRRPSPPSGCHCEPGPAARGKAEPAKGFPAHAE